MSNQTNKNNAGCYHGKTVVHQGDILLVNFGSERKGSRSLSGNRPVYVIGNRAGNKSDSVLMVIPLFRRRSRDNASRDIEIRPMDCRGLRYSEYAQVINVQKIRKHQVIRRIGHVKDETIHADLLSSMWEQVERTDGR